MMHGRLPGSRSVFLHRAAGALLFLVGVGASADAQTVNIFTAQQLDDVRNNLAGSYSLQADIDLAGFAFAPIGTAALPFTGKFNGNGHVISNFAYDGLFQLQNDVGLFGFVMGAKIARVTLRDFTVSGYEDVGGLIGTAMESTVTLCVADHSAAAQPSSVLALRAAGGLIGQVHNATVDNCLSRADTFALDRWSGSLIGHVHLGSLVRQCRAYGHASGTAVVGGLAGNVHGAVMEECHAYGEVTATYLCGGLTGYLQRDLTNDPPLATVVRGSYASGSVTSTGYGLLMFTDPAGNLIIALAANGGLAGWMDAGTQVEHCKAAGAVDAPANTQTVCGGLVGFAQGDCSITASVAEGDVLHGHTAGGLLGWGQAGTLIQDCEASGAVNCVWQSGGLVGAAEACTIDHCQAFGDISGTGVPNGHGETGHTVAAIGGLVGYTFPQAGQPYATTIHASAAHGDVSATGQFTGGLVGLCWGASVSECYATGSVTCADRRVGGLIGGVVAKAGANVGNADQPSFIADCHASGTVLQTATDPAYAGLMGGLVGEVNSLSAVTSHLERCYAVGAVMPSAPTVGGLIGDLVPASGVSDCYFDVQTSGQTFSDGGTGKTTVEMMTQATFTGWDFTTLWSIDVNPPSYPYLDVP